MAEYKLFYFDLKGRGEIIRLIFHAAGKKFEDVRFKREQWPEYKSKSPFGQCPFLEIKEGSNTVVMAQSIAITRYLARKFGLAGKDDLEAGICDMYADQMNDLISEMGKVFRETDEAKKKELQEKLATEIAPAHMKILEERLAKSGSGFFVSSGFTWTDALLFVLLDWVPAKDTVLANFPHIKQLSEKVSAIPGIAEWLKVRPVTEM